MKRLPMWFVLTIIGIPVLAVLIQCGSTSMSPTPLPPINEVMKTPDALVRSKIQGCNSDTDCTKAAVTPRCALNSSASVYCDTSDAGVPLPPGKNGLCAFTIPVNDGRCYCYEGDIRYCDLYGLGSCTQKTLGNCGIQMCSKGVWGQDQVPPPPSPLWGPCLPQVPPSPPPTDGGADATADGAPGP
jgi:hypothetical protein